MKGYKTTYIDIMIHDRFYCQVAYEYNPLWHIDHSEVKEYVMKQKPELKRKDFTMAFSNQRVFKN